MEQIIKLQGGGEVKLASSASFLYVYMNQFGENPFPKLFDMSKMFMERQKDKPKESDTQDEENKDEESKAATISESIRYLDLMTSIDILYLQNITWALAKNADSAVPEPMQFYQEHPEFLPMDYVEDIINLAIGSLVSTEEVKN